LHFNAKLHVLSLVLDVHEPIVLEEPEVFGSIVVIFDEIRSAFDFYPVLLNVLLFKKELDLLFIERINDCFNVVEEGQLVLETRSMLLIKRHCRDMLELEWHLNCSDAGCGIFIRIELLADEVFRNHASFYLVSHCLCVLDDEILNVVMGHAFAE